MAAPNWNSRPEEYCNEARRRAIAALHSKHASGLTALEKAYLKSLKEGRIIPEEQRPKNEGACHCGAVVPEPKGGLARSWWRRAKHMAHLQHCALKEQQQ